jgi:hypothetical protein
MENGDWISLTTPRLHREENEMIQQRFPALPGYDGPIAGWFHAIHHNSVVEWSDNINERIAFIRTNKPAHEVQIRLSNLMYVGDYVASCAEYATACGELDADYADKRAPVDAGYLSQCDELNEAYCSGMALSDYNVRRNKLDAEYNSTCDELDADYRLQRNVLDTIKVLPFIKLHNPNSNWIAGLGLDFSHAE